MIDDDSTADDAAARIRRALNEGRTPRRADVRGLLAEHDQLRDDMALTEALSAQQARQLAERTADRDRLAARLSELARTHPPCAATTPVHGSACVAGFRGHTGDHWTMGGWTWIS